MTSSSRATRWRGASDARLENQPSYTQLHRLRLIMTKDSPGKGLQAAVEAERPLQVVGTINAYCALLAQRAGFRAIYLSGAGVANASFGLPDLGITTLNDVLEDARRITRATKIPLLVDADTGFGSAFSIARTVRDMITAGGGGGPPQGQGQAQRRGPPPGQGPG